MKKTVATICLLVIIAISFSFIILRILANGSENNFFNLEYREKFAQKEFWRQVLGLHFDGDEKSDYLGSHYSKIVIEVDEMVGLSVPTQSLELLKQKMSTATGKEVSYVVTHNAIPYSERVSEDEIKNFVS